MTKTEQAVMATMDEQIKAKDLQIAALQAALAAAKNESVNRASFAACMTRLSELRVKPAAIIRGARILGAARLGQANFTRAFAKLSYGDKHGHFPVKKGAV